MKEYKCDKCAEPCFLQVDNDAEHPMWCPYSDLRKVCNWHEVVDSAENAHATNDQFGNSEQLPDWCKVGEWAYDVVFRDYGCIKKEDDFGWYVDNIESGRIKQARKRQFNDKEMQNLVGKVIENTNIVLLVNSYGKLTGDVGTYCGRYTAESLMDNGFVINGKPCYKLEHLNEKGEWVE